MNYKINNDKKPARDFSALFNIAVIMLPVLGVLFLGWSAFDMVFIYLSESAITSFFGFKKQHLINAYRRKVHSPDSKTVAGDNSAVWVFFLFGFFYLVIRMMGSFVHAFDYSKDVIDLRHFPLLSLFLGFMLAPLIHNPELIILIGFSFTVTLIRHINFVKEKKFENPADKNPDKIFGTAILTLFVTVFISFTFFWFSTLLGSLCGFSAERFVNVVLAFVFLALQNYKQIWKLLNDYWRS